MPFTSSLGSHFFGLTPVAEELSRNKFPILMLAVGARALRFFRGWLFSAEPDGSRAVVLIV